MTVDFTSGWLSKWWFRNLLVISLFLIIGFSVYWNSLDNSFQFDDEIVITYNKNIRSLSNTFNFFIKPGMISADPYSVKHYRPLVVLSYAINYAIGGYNPVVYHLTNIIIHIVTAFLVYLILKAMLGIIAWGGYFPAIAAGLVFLVHPFNAEAVNYITARFGVMSALFYLLAFYCWVLFRSQKLEVRSKKSEVRRKMPDEQRQGFSNFLSLASCFYIASLLSFVAAMLCKEIAVTLPVVLWLYDIYFFNPDTRGGGSLLKDKIFNFRSYLCYLPFLFVVIVPYLFIRFISYHSVLSQFQRSLFVQLMTEAPVLIKHWQLFFLPYPLTIGHMINIQKVFWSFPVIYSGIILIIYIVFAVLFYRINATTWKVVSFFMFWFFIVLIPTTFLPLNAIFQENRGYLAVISFAVLIGVILGLLRNARLRYPAVIALIIIVAVYSVLTINQNKVWKDEITLWSDVLGKYPVSPLGYTVLSVAYRRAGKIDKSLEASRRALLLGGEDNYIVHDNIAQIQISMEKWDLAAEELEKAIKGYQYKPQSHNDLGIAYYKTGKLDLAESQYKEAIRLDNMYHQAWNNLGALYLEQGRLTEAIQAYKNVLVITPSHIKSMFQLGLLYERLGKKKEAAGYYKLIFQQKVDGQEELGKEAVNRLKIMGEQ